jgi:HSP20 family protein
VPRKTKQTKLEEEIKMEQSAEAAEEGIADTIVAQPISEQKMPAAGIFDEVGELVVDVFETGADFVVSAAIAGIQIKDLDISLEKDMMVIKGDRCNPHMQQVDKKYFYQECYWGPFSRKIVLPENIDVDKADAQIDKGILTVKIPKNEGPEGYPSGKVGIRAS